MKKIYLLVPALLLSHLIMAQLEVNDTLLLAFKNDVFWSSSSELELGSYADLGKYGSTNLADEDPETCWAEGSDGDGTGEFILMTIPENTLKLKVRNGFQKSESIYYANNRPKNIEFTLYASYEPAGFVTETHTGFFISEPLSKSTATLDDKMGFQEIETGIYWPDIMSELSHDRTFDKDRFILKIKILDVYKGTKWDDACISDIHIIPEPFYELCADEHGLLKNQEQQIDTLFYNLENIYQVVELSADRKWIIFIIMPSEIENSRAETIYKLYNTKKEEFIEIKDVYSMYGFDTEDGKLYLQGSDNDFNDFSICLDEL